MSGIVLLERARDSIQAHASRSYPSEACGLLIGRVEADGMRVTRALPCPNTADPGERGRRFMIDPRAVLNVRRSLRGGVDRILGFYHSHPDELATPSEVDLECLGLWPETLWMIVPVLHGDAGSPRVWWLASETGAEVEELSIRVLAPRVAGFAACPE